MKNTEVIQVDGLDFNINTLKILSQVSLSVSKNEFVGLVGPNGSGKSTLLKNIYRHHTPSSGMIYLNGKDVFKMKSKEVAQQMAIVAQENQPDFDFSVREMVMMGRYSRKKMLEAEHSRWSVCRGQKNEAFSAFPEGKNRGSIWQWHLHRKAN